LLHVKTGGISGKHWALDGSTPLAAFISYSHRRRPSNAPRHSRHIKQPKSINDFTINASPQPLPLIVVTEKLGAAVRPIKNLPNFVSTPKFHCRLYSSRYRPPLSQTNPVHNRERPKMVVRGLGLVGTVTRLRSVQFDAQQGKALGPSQHVVPGYHPAAVMRPGHEAGPFACMLCRS
jgi:hypothetical protein